MRKICIATGSRAEWGLLSRLAAMIRDDEELQLQIIATNMHLSKRFGYTYQEIEADGFTIDYKIPMDIGGDSAKDTVRSMALAMNGFAEAYTNLSPDILVVLGDRYEILAAVSSALIFRIPVAHLHGGEVTEGAYDDAIRHAITKMSHLHFTSTEEYRERVIQMGENPKNVFNVGAIGVENITQIPLWSKEDTEESLGDFTLDKNTALVTYHPVTLEKNTAEHQINELLKALDSLSQLRVIFTMPNSDTGNFVISQKIGQWCLANKERAIWFTSLGLKRYLSTLQYIGLVVGNSSSGIIEVPSFGIPTINIGDRQKGRIMADSVIPCTPQSIDIYNAILKGLNNRDKGIQIENPYAKIGTVQNIYSQLKTCNLSNLIMKSFYDFK